MDERQIKFLENVPESAKGIVERAFRKTGPKSNAIKAHCLTCTGFDRELVRNCPVTLCPLHNYRPFQVKQIAETEDEDDDTDLI